MLLKRLNQLEQEVGELRAKLSAVEAAQQDQQIQSEPAAQVNDGNSITWKGAPEFKSDEGWRFKPRGRLQFDAASLSSLPPAVDVPGEGFSNEARRIRLGAQGNMPGGFGFKFEVNFERYCHY